MDNSFFDYLHRLELIAFFSGYPLVYSVINAISSGTGRKMEFGKRMKFVVPFAYALVATLYLGFILRQLYPDYTFENIRQSFHGGWLKAWGLLAILFWIPVIAKKRILSLLHSLVFFFLLLNDLFFTSTSDNTILRNDMKLYGTSFLLNSMAVIFIFLLFILINYFLRFSKASDAGTRY